MTAVLQCAQCGHFWNRARTGRLMTGKLANRVTSYVVAILRSKGGATAIEYALIGSIVSVMIWVSITLLSGELSNLFTAITDAFKIGQ